MANNVSTVVVSYDNHESNVTICAKFVGKIPPPGLEPGSLG
jgi:hypothetical protein